MLAARNTCLAYQAEINREAVGCLSSMSKASQVQVYEQYESYKPPFNIKCAVERMLAVVPVQYLIGLGSIVLTCESALTGKSARRKTWSRGKKVSAAKALGLYYPKWGSNPAWIELHVDSIFKSFPWIFLRISLMRELKLGSVFFHELGHHIHAQHHPEFREKENVADVWKSKGQNTYLRKRFWYWYPLIEILRWLDDRLDFRGRLRTLANKKRMAAGATRSR
jgi:hypothetical protein